MRNNLLSSCSTSTCRTATPCPARPRATNGDAYVRARRAARTATPCRWRTASNSAGQWALHSAPAQPPRVHGARPRRPVRPEDDPRACPQPLPPHQRRGGSPLLRAAVEGITGTGVHTSAAPEVLAHPRHRGAAAAPEVLAHQRGSSLAATTSAAAQQPAQHRAAAPQQAPQQPAQRAPQQPAQQHRSRLGHTETSAALHGSAPALGPARASPALGPACGAAALRHGHRHGEGAPCRPGPGGLSARMWARAVLTGGSGKKKGASGSLGVALGHARAVASCFSRSATYKSATSGARGSSGLGSSMRERMLSSTF